MNEQEQPGWCQRCKHECHSTMDGCWAGLNESCASCEAAPEPQTAPETGLLITDDAVSTLNAATEQITLLWARIATLEKALRNVLEYVWGDECDHGVQGHGAVRTLR